MSSEKSTVFRSLGTNHHQRAELQNHWFLFLSSGEYQNIGWKIQYRIILYPCYQWCYVIYGFIGWWYVIYGFIWWNIYIRFQLFHSLIAIRLKFAMVLLECCRILMRKKRWNETRIWSLNLERKSNCHIDECYTFLCPCTSLEQLFNLSIFISPIYGCWSLKQKHFKHMHQIIIHIYIRNSICYVLEITLCKLSLHISVSS